MEHQTLVSIGEAARIAGVSSDTIRRWADTGRIPSTRTAGGHRRVPVSAVKPDDDELQRLPAKRTAPHLIIPSVSHIAVDWADWTPPDRLTDEKLADLANTIDGGPNAHGLIHDLLQVAQRCRDTINARVEDASNDDPEDITSNNGTLPPWTSRQN